MRGVAQATDIGARRAWLWRNNSLFRQAAPTAWPRLFIDVSAIMRHDAQTGIQRVVRAVSSELQKRSGKGFEVQPVYATNRHGYCLAPPDFLDDAIGHDSGVPASLGPGDKFLGLDLAAHLLPKYRQQLRAWRQNGGSVHVVVYDLLPIERPEWFTETARKNFRKWTEVLKTEVDQCICISDEVARKVSVELAGTMGRIGRLYMGADMAASRPSTGLSSEVESVVKKMRNQPTVLMVGTVEPRKGYDVALNAFENLWGDAPATAPNLVIVGKSGWKTSALQKRLLGHPELGWRLHWLDRVSDEGLALLYEAASGVLTTSRGEGFGLPLVEASTHGRYVLARDLAVFREQRLPNVLYFVDDSPAALGRRLMDLVEVGLERAPVAELPSWADSVNHLLAELGFADLQDQSYEKSLSLV